VSLEEDELPNTHDWQTMSPGEKMAWLLNQALDVKRDILTMPCRTLTTIASRPTGSGPWSLTPPTQQLNKRSGCGQTSSRQPPTMTGSRSFWRKGEGWQILKLNASTRSGTTSRPGSIRASFCAGSVT
jgi:hypothetical protein